MATPAKKTAKKTAKKAAKKAAPPAQRTGADRKTGLGGTPAKKAAPPAVRPPTSPPTGGGTAIGGMAPGAAARNAGFTRDTVSQILRDAGMDPHAAVVARIVGDVVTGKLSIDDLRSAAASGQLPAFNQAPGANPGGSSGMAVAGGGSPGEFVPPTAQDPTVDFYAMAQALFPWLPRDLIRAYAKGMAEFNGDPAMGIARMREHRSYDEFFKGNRRTDGTFRYSELDYMATIDGYRQNLASRGINPTLFADKEHLWIEGDVSVNEHQARIEGYDAYLRRWGPEGTNGYSAAIEWYAGAYGVQMTEEAVLVDMMDHEVGTDVIKGRIPLAQVGGAAASFGYRRTVGDVTRLAGWGLTADQALDVYAAASQRLSTMDAMARRAYDPQGGADIGAFESAFVGRDATQQLRFGRNLQAEQASFSRRGLVREDESGRMAGLRSR